MSWAQVADAIAGACFLAGALLALIAAIGILVLVGLFQLLTTPVANHMMGRASIRAGQVREDLLVVNDLHGVASDHQEPSGAP